MDWHLIVPGAPELAGADLSAAREVRLRPGQPVWALLPEGPWRGSHLLTPEEIYRAAQALTGHALAGSQRELRAGFLPLPGGHRLGVCGVMDGQGLRAVTSLCVRLCHEVRGAGAQVFPALGDRNALIVGPPGAGKTTLLRDLARLLGESGRQVGIIDERGEIAACRDGRPLLDVGPLCDVVTGMEKAGAVMLLVRAMAPQAIVTDEIGGPRDAEALREAARCGAQILASAHGRDMADLRCRRGIGGLLPLFQRFVLLAAPGEAPQILNSDGENMPCG